MLARLRVLGLFISVCLASGHAASTNVTVSFVDPATFTDADDTTNGLRPLLEIEAHLQRLGERYLPPRTTVRIDVLDVQLAGSVHLSSTGWKARYMTGDADWPRILVRYTVETGGRASLPVEETIVDRSYLRRVDREYPYAVALPHEKRMLNEWFKARFAGAPPMH
ncbi:MAG: DUF3016 domain-containing protein [Acidobacteria bacterium]|nr:DUF3016 domain-containing protein [Acidobacteriota bacterium]